MNVRYSYLQTSVLVIKYRNELIYRLSGGSYSVLNLVRIRALKGKHEFEQDKEIKTQFSRVQARNVGMSMTPRLKIAEIVTIKIGEDSDK